MEADILMKKKYLIISTVGDHSLHSEWLAGERNFDVFLLYYGNNAEKEKQYKQQADYFVADRGVSKFIKIKKAIEEHIDLVKQYTHIWLPDDDISISTTAINQLFNTAEENKLLLCQPAMTGYISHDITSPRPGGNIRYTCFVEVLAPLFSRETLLKLLHTFDMTVSSWGIEYIWVDKLGYPKKQIAIIDNITMEHTRPVGKDYSRFSVNPEEEMTRLLKPYRNKIRFNKMLFSLYHADLKTVKAMVKSFAQQFKIKKD